MTTYTCEICYEEKTLGQMTLCGNGHFGGCQNCQMKLIKAAYQTCGPDWRVFTVADAKVQKCMFCRNPLHDPQMGENWSRKLRKLQPIMMLANAKRFPQYEHIDMYESLEKVYNKDDMAEPEQNNYDGFERWMESTGRTQEEKIKILCKTLGEMYKKRNYQVGVDSVQELVDATVASM